ncbi:MAG: SGNH/GDSL hydrolase family protein, partial [Actinomycetia bacterium]|nr:SGNH/GDSL hydrolase family protein [Actinomycetes bacterium]
AAPRYLALGDSYASGLGAWSYDTKTWSCRQSSKAYAKLLAAQKGWTLDFKACMGHTSTQVKGQLASVTTAQNVRYVTVSAGGNDLGFGGVLGTCGTKNTAACKTAINNAFSTSKVSALKTNLNSLYAEIKKKAPNARIAVVGYPRIFGSNTGFCPGRILDLQEAKDVNAAVDRLNGIIKDRAQAAGLRYADAQAYFGGHGVCGSSGQTEWINGWMGWISLPYDLESFHPKSSGHQYGYLPAVKKALGV